MRRLLCGKILRLRICGAWPRLRRMRGRAVGLLPWQRSMTAAGARMRRGIGGVGLQVIRDWVLRFNTEGPGGLIDRKAPGKSPKLDDGQRRALVEIVEEGPIPAIHGVVRWRLKDLAQWIWDKFRISLTEPTVSRELKAMGFTKMTARPRHHAQNELALEDFKKTSRPSWSKLRQRLPGWCRDRALVARRSAHRSEKQDHTALRAPGHPAPGRRTTSAPNGSISSAPSARPKAKRRA